MWDLVLKLIGAFTGKATDKIADKVGEAVGKRIADQLEPLAPADLELPTGIAVVPKGLRAFDEGDASFFLWLLPGPHRDDGLPESIHYWKTRIEEKDATKTFRVGLIYGPSGCGKSSLVKAGLIPHLGEHVTPVYVEATASNTEDRLLAALKQHCPYLSPKSSLRAALRRKDEVPTGEKVLIVLDQFEQYLHATPIDDQKDLLDALRECDGNRLLCVVMVRDDFITPVTRFVNALDIELSQNENYALVDLFDKRHAKKVLAIFGQAFGALPKSGKFTKEQDEFLNQAVSELLEGDYVICVRLALVAQMVRAKDWTPATLRTIGGAEGVGIVFLEESFVAKTAPLEQRRHQAAARKILNALLPEPGTSIKGIMRSKQDLRENSGYARRPAEFEELLEILDSKLRLLTPAEPVAHESEGGSQETAASSDDKYYQLTHDYLVPSLREWLTQKQKESRRGRAELCLAERSLLWNEKPENRRLPVWWEHINIRLLTRKKHWSEPQRKMMRRAAGNHSIRGFAGLLVLTVAIVAGLVINRDIVRTRNRDRADALVRNLKKADIENVPEIVREIDSFREVVGEYLDQQLRAEHEKAAIGSPEKLRTAVVLLPVDGNQVGYLCDRLLDCSMDELGVLRDSLQPHHVRVTARLWTTFRDDSDTNKRFRAGLALAWYVPNDNRWTDEDATFLVDTLLGYPQEEQPQIRNYLPEIKTRLYVDLKRAFRDPAAKERQEIGSAKAFAQFAADDIGRIVDLATEATDAQYAVLYPVLEASSDPAIQEMLRTVVAQQPDEELSQSDRVTLGRRRAGAAITLLRMGDREQIFDVFRVTDDPESLTQFVHRCREHGVTVAQLLDCLDRADALRQNSTGDQRKREDRILFGLLLALGEFAATDVTSPQREELVSRLVDWYANDPSSTVHGASGWLLRHWGHQGEAEKIDQTEIAYAKDREWFVKKIDAEMPDSTDGERQKRPFYFTFIVFEDGEYVIGSPDNEVDRDTDEAKQSVSLTRSFAVLDREITREEYEAFMGEIEGIDQWSPTGKHPVVSPSWYECVAFCRALSTRAGLPEEEQCYADPKTLDPTDFPREPDPEYTQYPRNWEVRLDRSGFRLPTEAEWEVMCRAGTRSMYNFGSDRSLLNRYGWFFDNAGKQTQLPRSLRPNLRGLFDMHGNVLEWCHDWYGSRRDKNTENPFGPPAGSSRVLRGGGWDSDASYCRSANRLNDLPQDRGANYGLLIVLVLFPGRP